LEAVLTAFDPAFGASDTFNPVSPVYAFDATAADGTLRFVQRGGAPVAEFSEDDLVDDGKGALSRLTRAQESDLPREAAIGFIDALMDYRHAAASSRRLVGGAARVVATSVAVVTNDAAAARRAEIFLQDLWAGRERAEFLLGQH